MCWEIPALCWVLQEGTWLRQGAPESPILLVKDHIHTIQQVSDVTTVPNETEREKTNSQCRLWGGPTVSGSSELEVRGGTGNSEVFTLSSLGRERACPVEG